MSNFFIKEKRKGSELFTCSEDYFAEALVWQEFVEKMMRIYIGENCSYATMLEIVLHLRLEFDRLIKEKKK